MKDHKPLFPDLAPPTEPPVPDLSPEARRKEAIYLATHETDDLVNHGTGPVTHAFEIVKRVLLGAWNDGFIHAGNLAYMAMLAIFPFFILGAATLSLVGEESERTAAINAVAFALPPVVANVIAPVARDVVEARTGWLLWAGAFAGLWTVGSLVETIRDILRRAYGTRPTRSFWHYRALSSGIIMAAVVLLMVSLIAQVMIGTAQEVIEARLPQLSDAAANLSLSRLVPTVGLYGSLYLLFYTLTPARYRRRQYPKWPGAMLVTAWWLAAASMLPPLLHSVFAYDLTYGSLAGMMIALFFFWLVGLGMVMGAELNAALAETPEEREMRRRSGESGTQSPIRNEGESSA